jgi:hypothetical protein
MFLRSTETAKTIGADAKRNLLAVNTELTRYLFI